MPDQTASPRSSTRPNPPTLTDQPDRPGTVSDPAVTARAVLRTRLTAAMKQRDRVAAGALRSALGAIDNAEAVDADTADVPVVGGEYVAGAAVGVGATEVSRRTLTVAEIRRIVEQEIEDRRLAVPQYQGAGDRAAQRATDLQHEVETLLAVLPELPLGPQP